MTSLSRAIIGRTVAMLMIVGLTAAVASYEAALYEANEFMDDYLRQFADAAHVFGPSRYLREPEDRFEQIVWTNGTRSSATPGVPAQIAVPAREGFGNVVAGGEAWRTFVVRDGGAISMLLQRASARQELAQHVAIEISLVILATMLVVWLVVTFTVGRVMRHFGQLGADIAARSVDANDPLPLGEMPREIKPLVGAMNVLIERQRAALRQQRLFIADSAHELRTPLTALRLQIENLKSVDGASSGAVAAALHDGIVRAATMLNQLLRMARFDAAPDEAREDVDLGDLLMQAVADVVEIAEEGGVDIGITKLEPSVVHIVRNDVQILVSNILDNAVKYTPRGGTVDCLLMRAGAGARIEIVDTGPGVRPEDLPRLCDRFFRAATLDKRGSGLGLAIVKAIADRHGLTVTIANRTDRTGLEVVVDFPSR